MAVQTNQDSRASQGTVPAGVPMGGIGAGCIEMGLDGRFRNITINNNRTADTRIPVSPGAFLAVRAARRGKVLMRLLQSGSDVPFEQAGIVAPFTPEEQLTWRGFYPSARYHLNDPKFPLEVRWRAFSPIVPYDLDASTLPVLYVTVELYNPTDDVYDASAVLNWENLNGCVQGRFPDDRGPMRPINMTSLIPPERRAKDKEDQTQFERDLDERPRYIGFEFGSPVARTNNEGHYCLVTQPLRHVENSVRTWNERDPSSVAEFWQSFYYEGTMGNEFTMDPSAHSGALCSSIELAPKARQQFVFILTWYCPRYEVNGVDYGNGYTNQFGNAWEIALRALKYHAYYSEAVEGWQKRLLTSSLPGWFSRMLINNMHVFSTNTFLAKDGRFATMETPADPLMGSLDRRFHSSLGLLLFFPELEHRELAQFGRAEDKEQPGRIYRHLGRLSLDEPSFGSASDELVDINPKFVLMAYRNFHMTGRRAALDQLYPRLKQAMEYMLSKDEDRDGLPEQSGISTTFDNYPLYGINSYTSSLWIVALRAYIKIARRLGHTDEVERYEPILARAMERFEQCLWIPEKGYYRLYCDNEKTSQRDDIREDGCHSGQLAGQWYADFLCLGHLFPSDHIQSALEVMWQMNEAPYRERLRQRARKHRSQPPPEPARAELSWPAFYATHCACLHIHHRNANRGFYCIQSMYHDIHMEGGRTFNQPLAWDRAGHRAVGWGADRHMGAPSIWHVLYALEGFYLDVPDQALWVRPNLPTNVHTLSAPVFTPVCLGWLDFQEEPGSVYRQRVRITFDSPIRIKTVVLRVPADVADVRVHLVSPAGVEATNHVLGFDGDERLVEIIPQNTVLMNGPTTITLEQLPPPPPPVNKT